MKQAFLVLGGQGNGTYMLTEALVAAGCHWEQWHESHHEDYKFGEMPSPFVFHRSIPHKGLWQPYWKPSPIHELSHSFDKVHVLAITRDVHCAALSVARRSGMDYEKSLYEQRAAIYQAVNPAQDGRAHKFTQISYESFTTSEGFRKWLFEERLNLPFPADYKVENRNLQYYG